MSLFLNLVHKNQYLLTENIVQAFKSSKEVKESGFGLDKFIITDFSLDSTGNYYLLSENIAKTTIKEETYWVSSGFFVIKFNINGNFIWGSPVPLNQQHKELNFIGTFLVNSNHYKRYFYNDFVAVENDKQSFYFSLFEKREFIFSSYVWINLFKLLYYISYDTSEVTTKSGYWLGFFPKLTGPGGHAVSVL